ncbi:hypothetical protein Pan216_22560 [Planctomycetes bacterium Pan216]|uniref:Uncharacterized protein n=1 Tax=Kolteria novifilia TaxID=2527975 RepID=A0A518B328_9BACT|nr:hypothetical protein Pan216_22560 [Planctomycetes bacterium Pan216]
MRPGRFISSVAVTGFFAGLMGCGSTQSTFDRDPFVMNHLTHGKETPALHASDSDSKSTLDFASDEKMIPGESISRKSTNARAGSRPMAVPRGREATFAHDPDYRWINGRLTHQEGRRPGWYVRFAEKHDDDEYDGALLLANDPRLGMFREGDLVHVEGTVVEHGLGDNRYHLDNIALMGP